MAIFSGMATMKMFIWGTVRATRPKDTLVKSRTVMMGAPILIPVTNICPLT